MLKNYLRHLATTNFPENIEFSDTSRVIRFLLTVDTLKNAEDEALRKWTQLGSSRTFCRTNLPFLVKASVNIQKTD